MSKNGRIHAAAIAAHRIYKGHDYIHVDNEVEEVENGFWVNARVWVDAEEVEKKDERKAKPRAAPRHRGQMPDV